MDRQAKLSLFDDVEESVPKSSHTAAVLDLGESDDDNNNNV